MIINGQRAELSRRFFLGGLIAAPAVVSLHNIMPVRRLPLATAASIEEAVAFGDDAGQLLPIDLITKEAMKIFRRKLEVMGTVPELIEAGPMQLSKGLRQSHVDLQFSTADRTLPLHDFKVRVLEPAMDCLAENVAGKGRNAVLSRLKMVEMEQPKNIHEVASVSDGAVRMRGLSDYFIGTDSIVTRFDVLYQDDGHRKLRKNRLPMQIVGP